MLFIIKAIKQRELEPEFKEFRTFTVGERSESEKGKLFPHSLQKGSLISEGLVGTAMSDCRGLE